MLDVKPFQQSTGMCGPASLKMVLGFFGLEKSEEELAKLSDAHPHHGTTAENILKAAKQLGYDGLVRDFSDFNDIKKYLDEGKPPIVNWFSENDGHYSVVVSIDDKNIYLQDPELGRVREMCLEMFRRVWFDFHGDFITSKDDMFIRRLIVIHK